jgi:hypothetical protein
VNGPGWVAVPRAAPVRKHHPGRRRLPLPAHAHPLVRQFFETLAASELRQYQVAAAAGIGTNTVSGWKVNSPQLVTFEAALNVLGYRLAVVPLAEPEAPALLDEAA